MILKIIDNKHGVCTLHKIQSYVIALFKNEITLEYNKSFILIKRDIATGKLIADDIDGCEMFIDDKPIESLFDDLVLEQVKYIKETYTKQEEIDYHIKSLQQKTFISSHILTLILREF